MSKRARFSFWFNAKVLMCSGIVVKVFSLLLLLVLLKSSFSSSSSSSSIASSLFFPFFSSFSFVLVSMILLIFFFFLVFLLLLLFVVVFVVVIIQRVILTLLLLRIKHTRFEEYIHNTNTITTLFCVLCKVVFFNVLFCLFVLTFSPSFFLLLFLAQKMCLFTLLSVRHRRREKSNNERKMTVVLC